MNVVSRRYVVVFSVYVKLMYMYDDELCSFAILWGFFYEPWEHLSVYLIVHKLSLRTLFYEKI